MSKRKLIPLLIYILFLLVPIYWLLNMSFKSNTEILGGLTLWPHDFTFHNYKVIFTDPSWYTGYLNSLYYVSLNTVISLGVALPQRPMRFPATGFWGTSTCSSGC